MKRTLLLTLAAFAIGNVSFGQTDVADARTFSTGSTVTINSVATNGSELGIIRYTQDNTAGLACYGNMMSGVNRYDSITCTGPLIEFSGLLEISLVTNVVNHGQAVVQPLPVNIPITAAGESLESELVQIDNVTFVESGNFSGGSATYTITDGANTLDVRVNGSTNIAGTAIPTGPVSITAPLGQFNTNYQLVPRDLNDIVAYTPPATEINVLIDGNTVLSGSDYFMGNSSSLSITIENYGVNNLNISSANFTGANAGDFSSTITPGAVGGGSQQGYTINFTPSGIGSRFATLEIGNDDADENPYVINFEAVGTDNLATEPTANPSSLTFPTVEAYTVNGQYAAGTGASNYLVLWKKGSPITGVPADGTTYERGDAVGDAVVAYNGGGTSFTPRGVIANQDLYFAVYAFNGQDGFENYLTTAPLTGNVTSLGENIGNYYNGIDKTSSTFHQDLYSLINPHTEVTYFLYKLTVMDKFEVLDAPGGQSMVICALSGDTVTFSGPFDWTATGFSREHTFAHSWMPSWPADNPEEPEYNDQHNLYPANLDGANTPRSNLALDDIDGNVVHSFGQGRVGYKGTQLVYEPRPEQKGNAARAIMYMVTAYGFSLGGNMNSDNQSQETLKNWHFADLPDNYEIARHEYIYSNQNNRNPFIDSVDYACYIDFDAFAHDAAGCGNASVAEELAASFVVFPVPAEDVVYVQVNGTKIEGYRIIDLQGRVILSEDGVSLDVLKLDQQLSSGTYTIQVDTPYGTTQRKMVIK